MKGSDIDIHLSEQVARKAGQQIKEMTDELESHKDGHILFLKDILADQRKSDRRSKTWMFIIMLVMAIGMIVTCLYCQKLIKDQAENSNKRLIEFMQNAEFYTEVEMLTDDNSLNNGSINLTK